MPTIAPSANPCGLLPLDQVDIRRAGTVLEPFIEDVRDAYLAFGLKNIARTRVVVTERAREGKRHFAACRTDGSQILLSPDLIRLPVATAVGIIAHEFGHAADYLYPAAFERKFLGGATFRQYGLRSNDGVPRGVADRWRSRDDDEVEMSADAIAETVLSASEKRPIRIGYAGPCFLETIGAGIRPRPRGLR
jgi:hypothetical protein